MSRFVGDIHNYVSANGEVIRRAPCHRCGHELHGLKLPDKCPQCAAPVAFSVCGDYLCFYSPRWLRRITSGVYLLLFGLLGSLVLRFAAAVLLDDAVLLGSSIAFAGAIVICRGAWLMTTPNPSGISERMCNSSRLLLRGVMLLLAFATGAHLCAVACHPTSAAGQIATSILLLACALLTIAGDFAKLQFVQHLAMRIPDQALAWRAGGLKWAVLGANAALVFATGMASASLLTMDFEHPPQISNFPGAMGVALTGSCIILPLFVVLVILTAMSLDVLYRSARAVQAQIPLAINAWQNAKSGTPGHTNHADPTAITPDGPASALLDAPDIHQPAPAFHITSNSPTPPDPNPVTPLKVAHLAKSPTPADQPDP